MMRSSMMGSRNTDRMKKGSTGGDYVEFYQRVKDFAKYKNWDTKKTNAMLGNREAFEKEYKLVSRTSHIFYFLIYS